MGNVLRRLLGYKRQLNIPTGLITSMMVAGGFQVNRLHVGVNCLHQLPHASSLFLVNGTERVLCSSKRAWERDLVGVS